MRLKWFHDGKIRQKQVRWFGILLSMGLAAWIALSEGYIGAQQCAARSNVQDVMIAMEAESELQENEESWRVSKVETLKMIPIGKKPIEISIGIYN